MKATLDKNSNMALSIRNDIISRKIILPMNSSSVKAYLDTVYDYSALAGNAQAQLIQPFEQTTLLLKEMAGLSYTTIDGKVKLQERGSRYQRKDRYSSLTYGNFLLDEMNDERTKVKKQSQFLFLT